MDYSWPGGQASCLCSGKEMYIKNEKKTENWKKWDWIYNNNGDGFKWPGGYASCWGSGKQWRLKDEKKRLKTEKNGTEFTRMMEMEL